MAVSFIGLFALAGLAAVVFLAVLGLITLLTNSKTRDLAKILLGGLAAMALLVVLVGGLFVARAKVATSVENEHWNGPAPAAEVVGEIELEPEAEAPVEVTETSADVALPPDPRERESIDSAVDSEESTPSESIDQAVVTDESEPIAEEAEPVAEEPKSMPEQAEAVTEDAATIPEEPAGSGAAELSVAPLPDAPNRPAWVDRKPYKEGSVYCWPVATDPRPDVLEAEEEALPIALDSAVADYVKDKLKLGSMASRRIHLAPDYVRNKLVGADIWIEPHRLSMGEFVQMHALVKFDFEANSMIRDQWDKQRLVGRLWSAGGFLAVVLLFLSLIYCYLKIDQVTGGSRRALLRFAAILVILGLMLVAAGVASVGIA